MEFKFFSFCFLPPLTGDEKSRYFFHRKELLLQCGKGERSFLPYFCTRPCCCSIPLELWTSKWKEKKATEKLLKLKKEHSGRSETDKAAKMITAITITSKNSFKVEKPPPHSPLLRYAPKVHLLHPSWSLCVRGSWMSIHSQQTRTHTTKDKLTSIFMTGGKYKRPRVRTHTHTHPRNHIVSLVMTRQQQQQQNRGKLFRGKTSWHAHQGWWRVRVRDNFQRRTGSEVFLGKFSLAAKMRLNLYKFSGFEVACFIFWRKIRR